MIENETPSMSDDKPAADDVSLEELIQEKRMRWEADKRDLRKNRLEGLWMSLFGLAIVALGFFLFGDVVNKARIYTFLMGFAVFVMGIYFMVTGRKLPEEPN